MSTRVRIWRAAWASVAIALVTTALAWFARIVSTRPMAPSFVLTDRHGHIHRLEDYHGRVLFLNF